MMHKDPGRTDLCTKSLCTKNCVRRTSVQKDLHERMYDHVLSCRFYLGLRRLRAFAGSGY